MVDQGTRTLWVGDLEKWMDESHLFSYFQHTGHCTQVKVLRDKNSNQSIGSGFAEFTSHAMAKHVIDTHNGQPIGYFPGKYYRLNWANYGINERREDAGPEFSLFAGDLDPNVSEMQLHNMFVNRYPSLRSVKVVTDPNTGLSKKYGFVRFRSEDDMHRALQEMQGQYCGNKPLRLNYANSKKNDDGPQTMDETTAESDPNNTCLFVGGLDVNTTEEEVRVHFQRFGEMTYIKIPTGKPYAFLSFTTKESARAAFEAHGTPIGRNRIRVSWGKLNFNSTLPQNSPRISGSRDMRSSGYGSYENSPVYNSPQNYSRSQQEMSQTPTQSAPEPAPPAFFNTIHPRITDFTQAISVSQTNESYLANYSSLMTLEPDSLVSFGDAYTTPVSSSAISIQ